MRYLELRNYELNPQSIEIPEGYLPSLPSLRILKPYGFEGEANELVLAEIIRAAPKLEEVQDVDSDNAMLITWRF